jgi:hypothetical protein
MSYQGVLLCTLIYQQARQYILSCFIYSINNDFTTALNQLDKIYANHGMYGEKGSPATGVNEISWTKYKQTMACTCMVKRESPLTGVNEGVVIINGMGLCMLGRGDQIQCI